MTMDDFYKSGLTFVAHYPVLNKITGRSTAGYLLSQILHWRATKDGGEFYKTDKEFCEELQMGPAEFRAAKKLLIDGELVRVIKRGIPSTSYYSVNMDRINSLVKNDESLVCNSPTKKSENHPTNSVDTTEIPVDTANTAVQEKNDKLPDLLGKTPLARLVSVYSLKFHELYGFQPKVMNWAMLGRLFKETLANYSELQIAAMILLHFDWHGASGDDQFTHSRLSDRCFPLEWVPKATNAYRAYIQNTMGIDFEDTEAMRKHVVSIIKPLHEQYVPTVG